MTNLIRFQRTKFEGIGRGKPTSPKAMECTGWARIFDESTRGGARPKPERHYSGGQMPPHVGAPSRWENDGG